ncbi:hypothetical protein D3C78_1482410 [compost metagenome]
MSQLMTDLLACTLIELSILSMTTTAINGCGEASQLLIALTGVSRPQLMKAFQSMLMQDVPCRSHNCLHKVFVAFVGRQQISAAIG